VAESRSQFRNRMLARARLRELLTESMKQPRKRRPTKPTRASKRRRLDDKRALSEKKDKRRTPRIE
ncbi:MAG: aminoacyl-tRNA hydrolase, partial [Acidimicrobiia bacterium]